jgi:hypothetical protein
MLKETVLLIKRKEYDDAIRNLELIIKQLNLYGTKVSENNAIRWVIKILDTKDDKAVPVALHVMQAVVKGTDCKGLDPLDIISMTE